MAGLKLANIYVFVILMLPLAGKETFNISLKKKYESVFFFSSNFAVVTRFLCTTILVMPLFSKNRSSTDLIRQTVF